MYEEKHTGTWEALGVPDENEVKSLVFFFRVKWEV